VWIMRLLNHPNIVHMAGIVKKPIALVTEYLPFGSLYQFLQREDAPKKLHWAMRIKILMDVAEGVAFMHSLQPQIMHRDLKTLNILMAADNENAPVVAKVADFGTCVAAATFAGRVVDNPLWLAPEIMAGCEYSEKADVYSFGMMLYEVLERKLPFDEFETKFLSKLEKQIEEGLRPTLPVDSTPPTYAELTRECWAGDPLVRPDFATIVKKLKQMQPDISKLPYGWVNPDALFRKEKGKKKSKKEEQAFMSQSNRENWSSPIWSISRTTTFSIDDTRGDFFSRSARHVEEKRGLFSLGRKSASKRTDSNSNKTDSNRLDRTFSTDSSFDADRADPDFSPKTASRTDTNSNTDSNSDKTFSKKQKKKEKKEKKKDKTPKKKRKGGRRRSRARKLSNSC